MSLDRIVVRPFTVDDWALCKEVRLKALQSDPKSFGSNYAKEAAYDDAKWREQLANPDVVAFGVFLDGKVIGMTGVMHSNADRSEAGLWGSWLEKEYRGRGVSALMYKARLDWVRSRPEIERVIVSHRESNLASKHANQKHGFHFTHSDDGKVWSDGKNEPEHFYELKVKNYVP